MTLLKWEEWFCFIEHNISNTRAHYTCDHWWKRTSLLISNTDMHKFLLYKHCNDIDWQSEIGKFGSPSVWYIFPFNVSWTDNGKMWLGQLIKGVDHRTAWYSVSSCGDETHSLWLKGFAVRNETVLLIPKWHAHSFVMQIYFKANILCNIKIFFVSYRVSI